MSRQTCGPAVYLPGEKTRAKFFSVDSVLGMCHLSPRARRHHEIVLSFYVCEVGETTTPSFQS